MGKYRMVLIVGLMGMLCLGCRWNNTADLWSGAAKTGVAVKTGAMAKTGVAVKTGAMAETGAAAKTGAVAETGAAGESSVQEGIAKEIIRLHVIADSDRTEDQMLKLEIKDAVVERLREELSGAEDIDGARKVIRDKLPEIEAIANRMIEERGFPYQAHAALEQSTFPIKKYGDLIFPAGSYEALRVKLGAAEGKNWWCVVFPTLCYVDETKEEISPENKEKLKSLLTEEEYESLLSKDGSRVVYKLKITQYLHKVIDYFAD